MKRILCLIGVVMILTACSSKASEADKYTNHAEFNDTLLEHENALEYTFTGYTLDEILDYYEEEHPEDFCDELLEYLYDRFYLMPDMKLIMVELAEQELYEEYATLFRIAEKIGYYPSAIIGAHCLEISTNVIHKTNSSCLADIDFSDMYFICEPSHKDLYAEMDDNDAYLQNCTLCPNCWFS